MRGRIYARWAQEEGGRRSACRGMGSESEVGEVAGGSASTRGARGCAERLEVMG